MESDGQILMVGSYSNIEELKFVLLVFLSLFLSSSLPLFLFSFSLAKVLCCHETEALRNLRVAARMGRALRPFRGRAETAPHKCRDRGGRHRRSYFVQQPGTPSPHASPDPRGRYPSVASVGGQDLDRWELLEEFDQPLYHRDIMPPVLQQTFGASAGHSRAS